MRRIPKLPRHLYRPKAPRRSVRLGVELLEDRATPAGIVTGVAFIDSDSDGVRDASETVVRGVTVNLSGTPTAGAAIDVNVTTDSNGAFRINDVPAGSFQLKGGPAATLLGADQSDAGGSTSSIAVTVTDSETTTNDLAFRGIAPSAISLRQFMASTTDADLPFAAAGSGVTSVNQRANVAPTVDTVIADVDVATNADDTLIDLAGHFEDTDLTNSLIRIETSAGPINVELFDRQTPRTVANFFNYITSDRFDDTVFHRLLPGFVLQGGSFAFETSPSRLESISTDDPVENEFQTSNTRGTLAMAKLPGDPDSATAGFFFNLADNNDPNDPNSLDNQNGGFTVFGRVVGAADQVVVDALAATPTRDFSAVSSAFEDFPIAASYTGTDFPTDTTAADYALLDDVTVVTRNETLTYSIASNSNLNLVNATVENNRLRLDYAATGTGTATIVVRATDRFGLSVEDTFIVTVS